MVRQCERDAKKIVKTVRDLVSQKPLVKIDYVSVVDTKNLKDVVSISHEALIAVAAQLGKTRLIDNIIVRT